MLFAHPESVGRTHPGHVVSEDDGSAEAGARAEVGRITLGKGSSSHLPGVRVSEYMRKLINK